VPVLAHRERGRLAFCGDDPHQVDLGLERVNVIRAQKEIFLADLAGRRAQFGERRGAGFAISYQLKWCCAHEFGNDLEPAHNSHTRAAVMKISSRLEAVLLIGSLSDRLRFELNNY
jgi:hypothetical protein